MDQTINRGYPFPECDPPLTKDASDIAHLRDLAVAVNDDVDAIYTRASDVLVRPDAARMATAATIPDTVNEFVPFLDARSFDTTGPANYMTPLAEGQLRLVEPGWYTVGCFVTLTSATFLGGRAAFLRNGAEGSWSMQAEIGLSNQQIINHTADVFVPVGNETLNIRVRIGAGSPSYTYVARVWAQQVIRG